MSKTCPCRRKPLRKHEFGHVGDSMGIHSLKFRQIASFAARRHNVWRCTRRRARMPRSFDQRPWVSSGEFVSEVGRWCQPGAANVRNRWPFGHSFRTGRRKLGFRPHIPGPLPMCVAKFGTQVRINPREPNEGSGAAWAGKENCATHPKLEPGSC